MKTIQPWLVEMAVTMMLVSLLASRVSVIALRKVMKDTLLDLVLAYLV